MPFGREDVLRLLHGLNPWWSGRTPALPRFRRPLAAAFRAHVRSDSARTVLLLSGLRGVGKTTLLLQLAADHVGEGADPRSVLYASLGHPLLSRMPISEVLRIHRDLVAPADGRSVLLLDDIHYATDWDAQVKSLLADAAGHRVVATESVQMVERSLVTETQHGRWGAVAAPTLSFSEYLALRGLDPAAARPRFDVGGAAPVEAPAIDEHAAALRAAVAHLPRYLAAGGLPELAAAEHDPHGAVHEDAAERLLRRDVALHFGARNVEDLKRLFVFLCLRTGDVFPVQRYARSAGISASTVAHHLDLLERCFLVRRIQPLGTGGVPLLKARHRVHVADPTLRCIQLLRGPECCADPAEAKALVATAVVRHVQGRFAPQLATFGYWRDPRSRRDVDLVVRRSEGTLAFQVWFDRPAVPSPHDPLVALCKAEPVRRAFFVTRDERDAAVFRLPGCATEFVKIPAHVLLHALGQEEARTVRA